MRNRKHHVEVMGYKVRLQAGSKGNISDEMDLSKIMLAIYHTGVVDVGQWVLSLGNGCFYTLLAKTPEQLIRAEWNRIRNNKQELRLYKKNETLIKGLQWELMDTSCQNLLFILVSECLKRDGRRIQPALEEDIRLTVTLRNNAVHNNIQTIEEAKRKSPTLASVDSVFVKDELHKIKDLFEINIIGKLRTYLSSYAKVFPEHKVDDILLRLDWLIKSVDIPDYWVQNIKEFESRIKEIKDITTQQETITKTMKKISSRLQANNKKQKQAVVQQEFINQAMKQRCDDFRANNVKLEQAAQQQEIMTQEMKQCSNDFTANNMRQEQTTQQQEAINQEMKQSSDSILANNVKLEHITQAMEQSSCNMQDNINKLERTTLQQETIAQTMQQHADNFQAHFEKLEAFTNPVEHEICSEQQPEHVQTATQILRVFTGSFEMGGDYNQLADSTSEITTRFKRTIEELVTAAESRESSAKRIKFVVTFLEEGSVIVHFQVMTTEEDETKAIELIKKVIREAGLFGLKASSIKVKAMVHSDSSPSNSGVGSSESKIEVMVHSDSKPSRAGAESSESNIEVMVHSDSRPSSSGAESSESKIEVLKDPTSDIDMFKKNVNQKDTCEPAQPDKEDTIKVITGEDKG